MRPPGGAADAADLTVPTGETPQHALQRARARNDDIIIDIIIIIIIDIFVRHHRVVSEHF